jgi:hypothetical protein
MNKKIKGVFKAIQEAIVPLPSRFKTPCYTSNMRNICPKCCWYRHSTQPVIFYDCTHEKVKHEDNTEILFRLKCRFYEG